MPVASSEAEVKNGDILLRSSCLDQHDFPLSLTLRVCMQRLPLRNEQGMTSRILVINDEQPILELFQLMLEQEGYDVHLSLIAFEDVREVERIAPALIILDLKVGKDTAGLLLLQQLRMYRPTMRIPIILCTAGLRMMQEQEEILRAKGIPIVYKPFDVDEMLAVVAHMLAPSLDA
jgi:DNA-binding response OmpR family regulator